jgi:hypothetical protein
MEVSGQLHAPAAFNPAVTRVGGWVGPRAGPDAVVKRTNPFMTPDGNWTLVVHPVA